MTVYLAAHVLACIGSRRWTNGRLAAGVHDPRIVVSTSGHNGLTIVAGKHRAYSITLVVFVILLVFNLLFLRRFFCLSSLYKMSSISFVNQEVSLRLI